MNQNSEIILEKMVDHFGEWEEPKKAQVVSFTQSKEKVLKKSTKKSIPKIRSESAIARREEILIFKEELKALNKRQISQVQISNDMYVKNRQAELIYAKEVIKAEMSRNIFTMAS